MKRADVLTPKQAAFAEEYLKDLNAKQAYIRAGYAARGQAAEASASALLRVPKVAARISKEMEARSTRTRIDSDWLLMRLAEEATADVLDLYTEQGNLKPVREWPKIWRQGLVAGLDVKQLVAYEDGESVPDGVVMKIKLSDRVKRLELIGRHVDVQAFKDKVELGVDADLAAILERAIGRADAAE